MNSKLFPVLSYLDSLQGRANLIQLEKLLIESGITAEDVSSSCIFNESHYARNKISGNDWYDLFVMCWRPGQHSTIHDHRDSSCALKILEGTATEIACELTNPEKSYVRKTRVSTYNEGECCAAQDNQIHQIANLSASQNLITMHIYSPPLKMGVYELDPQEASDALPLTA